MRQGGRQKGTPNKLTAQGRALIQGFLEKRTPDELEKLWKAAKEDSLTALRGPRSSARRS